MFAPTVRPLAHSWTLLNGALLRTPVNLTSSQGFRRKLQQSITIFYQALLNSIEKLVSHYVIVNAFIH